MKEGKYFNKTGNVAMEVAIKLQFQENEKSRQKHILAQNPGGIIISQNLN